MKTHTLYFGATQEALDYHDVWTLHVPVVGMLHHVCLANAIAPKVVVRSIALENFNLLAVEDVPGNMFREETAIMLSSTFRVNARIEICLRKLEPLLLSDCKEAIDDEGRRVRALGWVRYGAAPW